LKGERRIHALLADDGKLANPLPETGLLATGELLLAYAALLESGEISACIGSPATSATRCELAGCTMLSILDVPDVLRPDFPFPYPGHQRGPLVEAFADRYLRERAGDWPLDHAWTHIPAYWTSYACQTSRQKRFGRRVANWRMRRFLQTLPKGRRYFTISQHDDGLKQRGAFQSNQPIYEFSAGGCGDQPIPLLCDAHQPVPRRRDIRASFVGALSTSTHRYPCRDAMAAALNGHDEYLVRDVTPIWGERDDRSLAAKTADFIDVMCRSVFALCPRGYGKTSFRLYEAMQLGCVPVYIYDEPWLPYADAIDWNEICVLVHVSEASQLHDILAAISHRHIDAMRARIAELWPRYFTLEAVMRQLPRYLNAAASGQLEERSTRPQLRIAG
jgi:hypothetical protein